MDFIDFIDFIDLWGYNFVDQFVQEMNKDYVLNQLKIKIYWFKVFIKFRKIQFYKFY